jgi:hypothetical protein
MNNKTISPAYSHNVIEFITVAIEFCAFLEQTEDKNRKTFTDTILKLIPLLYLKANLIPKYEILDNENLPEDFVTEENYNIVRANINIIMGEQDDYLDVFIEDMKYSDTPISASISEDLADLYQEFYNLVASLRDLGTDDQLRLLEICKENFTEYWGQTLCNVMRALHWLSVRFK